MMRIIFALLVLAPSLVQCFDGIVCGDYKCSNDTNVYCDTNNRCACREGYIGNARIRCVPDVNHICTMMGDPHITTFNNESAFIFVPCTQILTELTKPAGTASEGPGFLLKVTAITDFVYMSRHVSQLMVSALYIETTTFANNELKMRCGTNGCWGINAPYPRITDYADQGLNITVTNDPYNGQTVIYLHGIEIRFRAEDGSVSIEIPPNATPDPVNPGLCNSPADASNFNAGLAQTLSLSYDAYLLYVNTGNIHNELDTDEQCLRRYSNACDPREREASATGACSGPFVDKNIRDCYYNYRNKNATWVMYDYNQCHDNACNSNYTMYCNDVLAACGAGSLPSVV